MFDTLIGKIITSLVSGLVLIGGYFGINANLGTAVRVLTIPQGGTSTSTAPTDGQLLIGSGGSYKLNTLTQGSNITITNGSGTISIASTGGGGGGSTTTIAGLQPANDIFQFDGTTNQITIATTSPNIITWSTPQNIHTGASPTFNGLTIGDGTGNKAITISGGGSNNQSLYLQETANNGLRVWHDTNAVISYFDTLAPADTYGDYYIRTRANVSPKTSIFGDHQTGYVGIGTNNVQAQLTVAGQASSTNLFTGIATTTNLAITGLAGQTGYLSVNSNGEVATSTPSISWLNPFLFYSPATNSSSSSEGRVLCQEFELPAIADVNGISYGVGSGSGGNVMGAIYYASSTIESMTGTTLIVQSGTSTAQGPTNNNQIITLATTTLNGGLYYSCISFSNATSSYLRNSNTAVTVTGFGQRFENTFNDGFPLVAPTMTNDQNNQPGMWIRFSR